MSLLQFDTNTSPVGSSSMRSFQVSTVAPLGGSATWVRDVPSNSKQWLGFPAQPSAWTGPAMQRTFPLGSNAAGASNACQKFPPASLGKSGPGAQLPGWFAIAGIV